MTINFTFFKNFFIAFLICFAVACTTDNANNSENTGNNNNSNSSGNNSGADSKDIEKAVTRSEALDELFNNTNLGSITLTVTQDQWDQLVRYSNNKNKTDYVKGNLKYEKNGKTYEMNDIGIRNRGNSSFRAPVDNNGNLQQAHFKLKFDKFLDDNAHHMKKALKGINLKFMLSDKSYVQEMYCYDLFKRFGVWTAPRCSYTKLYIKIGDNPESYFGIYKAIEPVAKQFIKARIASDKFSSDTGNLWKCLYQGAGPADLKNDNLSGKIGVDSNSYTPVYSLKTNEEKLNTEKSQLITFIENLNSKTGSDFKTWIESAFDVDLFLKTLAVSVSCGMWDDYWRNSNNYYLYFDGTGKAFFIPYDYDNTLGVTNDGLMQNPAEQDPLNWGKGNTAPLVTKILAISEYKEKYKEYLKELIEPSKEYFDIDSSKTRINSWYDLIRSSAVGYDASTSFDKDGESNWNLKEGIPSGKYSLLSSSNNYFYLRANAINKATDGQLPTYKVTFDANGGTFTRNYAGETSVTIENIKAETNPQTLITVEKSDSTFLGWYNNSNEKITKITSDTTLKAKWFELTPELLGYNADTTNNEITFTFDPAMYGMTDSEIETIHIWGSFNSWNTSDTTYSLVKGEDGIFSGTFELPSKNSEFKYGINGKDWKGASDRLSDYAVPEEYGTNNFIIKY